MKPKKYLFLILLFVVKTVSAQVPGNLSPADKIYGLSRFWQEVNYNFVYLNRVDANKWDSTYRALIPEVAKTTNDYAYYRLLQKFCSMLNDGHTHIELPPQIDSMVMVSMFTNCRVKFKNFDGRVIVCQTSKPGQAILPIGSEVLEVNDVPVSQYLKDNVLPYISASTAYGREDQAVYNLLEGLAGQSYKLKVRTPGSGVKTLTLTHGTPVDKNYYPATSPADDLFKLKWFDNKRIVYLALNTFADSAVVYRFKQHLAEIYTARAVIIDLRNNGGGDDDNGYNILQYFTTDKVLKTARSSTRQHLSAYKALGAQLAATDTLKNEISRRRYLDAHNNYYSALPSWPVPVDGGIKKLMVPTVILTGHNTASAAEDFLISTLNQKHMIKIGERSNGSTGQPYVFSLPGGGMALVCAKKDTYEDGREFVGFGIKPDVELSQSVDDFVAGRDSVLIKAIEYLKTHLQL